MASHLDEGVGKAKEEVESIIKDIKRGAGITEVIRAISGIDYSAKGTFGDLAKSLETMDDLEKIKGVLDKLDTGLTVIDTAAKMAEGSDISGSDAVTVLGNIISLTSDLADVPGAGSYIKFITGSLDAIAKGIDQIQGNIDDQNLSQMMSSCDDWANGPALSPDSKLYKIWKAGVIP